MLKYVFPSEHLVIALLEYLLLVVSSEYVNLCMHAFQPIKPATAMHFHMAIMLPQAVYKLSCLSVNKGMHGLLISCNMIFEFQYMHSYISTSYMYSMLS